LLLQLEPSSHPLLEFLLVYFSIKNCAVYFKGIKGKLENVPIALSEIYSVSHTDSADLLYLVLPFINILPF
jgi:hypothetical protein